MKSKANNSDISLLLDFIFGLHVDDEHEGNDQEIGESVMNKIGKQT